MVDGGSADFLQVQGYILAGLVIQRKIVTELAHCFL